MNGIGIDDIHYKTNDIKRAIVNNEPIEEKLNVIIMVSNPCLFATRYILTKEFIKRIEEEEDNVNLYVVELAYKNQQFMITEKHNKNHLQLRTEIPIWHKENMINLGVKNLLPQNYKAFAWIDADIEFESHTWAIDTLKILNGCKDVVQVYSHCIDMNHDGNNLSIYNSMGYCFTKGKKYAAKGSDFWHPGYAWAITRKAYEAMGGLYEVGVLGSGDKIMALGFVNKAEKMNQPEYSENYNASMLEFQEQAKKLRLGYTPGVIRHYYHGSKQNRRYLERWQLLMKYKFSPIDHLTHDASGILIPTEQFPEEFKDDIMTYFIERKEDN